MNSSRRYLAAAGQASAAAAKSTCMALTVLGRLDLRLRFALIMQWDLRTRPGGELGLDFSLQEPGSQLLGSFLVRATLDHSQRVGNEQRADARRRPDRDK